MMKLFLSIVLLSSEYIVNGQIRLPDQILQRRVNASGVFRATATEFPLVPKPTGRVITLFRSRSTAAACPPLVGTASPSGCNKNFVEDVDGDIPCQDDQDCPQSEEWWLDVLDEQCTEGKGVTVGKCSGNKRCAYKEATCELRNGEWTLFYEKVSDGSEPDYVSPTGGVTATSSCNYCQVSLLSNCNPSHLLICLLGTGIYCSKMRAT